MVGSGRLNGHMSVNTVESLKYPKHRALLVRGLVFNAVHIASIPQAVQNKKKEERSRWDNPDQHFK